MKRNKFSKALKHLKSKKIDEKLKLLDETPTNSMSGVYQVTPDTGDGFRMGPGDPERKFYPKADGTWPSGIPANSGDRVYIRKGGYFEKGKGVVPAVQNNTPRDLSLTYMNANGNDTSTMIRASDGAVYADLPEGTRSFILGPLMTSYSQNHMGLGGGLEDDFTNLGYIQKDTRQFVLLGRIEGFLDGTKRLDGGARTWDGTATQFTSYNSNFKLEHALWMQQRYNEGNFTANVPYNLSGGIPADRHPDDNSKGGGDAVGTNAGQQGGEDDNQGTPQDPPDGKPGFDPDGMDLQGLIDKALLAIDVALMGLSILGILFPEPTTSAAGAAGLAALLAKLRRLRALKAAAKAGKFKFPKFPKTPKPKFPKGKTPKPKTPKGKTPKPVDPAKTPDGKPFTDPSTGKPIKPKTPVRPDGKPLDPLPPIKPTTRRPSGGSSRPTRPGSKRPFDLPKGFKPSKPANVTTGSGKTPTPKPPKFTFKNPFKPKGKGLGGGADVGATGLKKPGFDALNPNQIGPKGMHKGSKGMLSPKGGGTYSAPKVGEVGPSPLRPGTGGARYTKFGSNPFGKGGQGGQGGGVVGSVVPKGARGISGIEPQKVVNPKSFQKGSDMFNRIMKGQYPKSKAAAKIREKGIKAGFKPGSGSIDFKNLPNLNMDFDLDFGMYLIEEVLSDDEQNRRLEALTQNPKFLENIDGIIKTLEDELEASKLYVLLFGDDEEEDVQESVITESKTRILREIRQPLREIQELPKTTKLKGYRPNFKGKFSPQNTPDVTASKESDDIVSAKNSSRQIWTAKDKFWKGYETTERMNIIYDNLGHGSQYFDRIVGENVRQKNKKSREVQEHLNMLAHQKAMREVYGIKEYENFIDESETYDNKINDPLFTKVAKRLKKEIDYPKKPAAKGYPDKPPAKIDPNTGMHPKFGKRYKYDKLDPISAKTMAGAPTGDPEIDANVKKAAKVKEDWRSDLKNLWLGSEREDWKKKLEEGMNTSDTFSYSISGKGDVDLTTTGTGYSADGVHQLQNIEPMTNVSDPTNAGKKFGRTHGYGGNTYGAINQYDTQAKADAGIEATYWDQPVTAALLDNNTNLRFSDYVWPFDRDATEAETNIAKAASKVRGENDCFRAVYPTNLSGDRHKATPVTTNTTVGTDDDYNTVGLGLQFGQGADTRDPKFFVPNPVNTSEIDTVQILASLPTSDSITSAGSQLQLFYWSGDKPGFQSLYPATSGGYPFTKNQNDGWRPIAMKPSGETDSSVSSNLIDIEKPVGYEVGKVSKFSIQIPEWVRSTSTRFMFVQLTQNGSMDRLVIYNIGYQRRNAITINTTLADEKASAYVRVGNNSQMAPEERKKKLNDMLKASREYMLKSLGFASLFNDEVKISDVVSNNFDYQSVMQGSGKFGNSRFNDLVSLEKRQKAVGIRKPQQTKRRGKFRGYQRTGRDSKGMTTRARVNPNDIIGSI